MGNLAKHLKTVRTHRKYVRKMCWKLGLFWQGLTHDLSKYSPTELSIYKYYIGTKSPHEVCRNTNGYSPSWMHHYHKNKHHWHYWLDIEDWPNKVAAAKMPYKYVVEAFCDMVGASKAYGRNNPDWTEKAVWDYWVNKCKGKRLMHKTSEYLLEKLLWNYYQLGEKRFIENYRSIKKYLITAYNSDTLLDEVKTPEIY